MADRFQPPLGVSDAKASQALSDVSRVLDAAPRLAFKPEISAIVNAAPGDMKRLIPRSGGMTVLLQAASAGTAGASIVLLIDASLGACTVKPVSGTINGEDSLVFSAGFVGRIEIESGGDSCWYTINAIGDTTASRSQQFDDTVTGTLDPYLLPASFRSGDSIVWVLTGNVTLNRIRMSDDSVPADGTVLYLSLRDQSGGSAPGWALTIVDTGAVTSNGSFRTPGQVQGTSPGPSYVMQSEEEGCTLICRQGNWRLVGGTAAQALAGEVTAAAGNGSTRTATVTRSTDFATTPWTGNHNFEGQLLLGTEQTDAGTGAVNVTLGDVIRLRFTSAAGNITLGTVSGCAEGRLLLVEFSGTGTHTVTHGSAALNSFDCPNDANLVMTGRCGFLAVGRGGTPAWKVLATTN